jgi:hypothetical protein
VKFDHVNADKSQVSDSRQSLYFLLQFLSSLRLCNTEIQSLQYL